MCFKLRMAHHKPQAVQPQWVRPVWVQGAGISGPGCVEGWPEVQSQRPLPQAPSSLQASWMARGDHSGYYCDTLFRHEDTETEIQRRGQGHTGSEWLSWVNPSLSSSKPTV